MVDIKDIISQFENANERKCGVILGFEDTPIVEAALKAAVARAESTATKPCNECPHDNRCEDHLDCPHDKDCDTAEAEFAKLYEKSKCTT